LELKAELRVRVRVRARFKDRCASELLRAECRYAVRGDRVPVAGTGYTTFPK